MTGVQTCALPISKQLLADYTLDLPVFFDWETIGTEPARTDGTSSRMVTDCCLEFCKLMEAAGYQTGVYTYIPVVYSEYILRDLEGLTIWMGDPGNWPEFYYEHAFWQYSFTGTVPGIENDVDLDVMYVHGTPPAAENTMPTPAVQAAPEPAEEEPGEPPADMEGGE